MELTHQLWKALYGSEQEAYQFGGFGPSYGEFQVCIFLPVAEKKRKFGQEAIIDISCCDDGLWTRVAIQAALEGFGGAD